MIGRIREHDAMMFLGFTGLGEARGDSREQERVMTLPELIQEHLFRLSPEKQREVLDFVTFLERNESRGERTIQTLGLRQSPAFGLWKSRNVDALAYEQALRAEWDEQE